MTAKEIEAFLAEAAEGFVRPESPEGALIGLVLDDIAGCAPPYLHDLLVLAATAYGMAMGKQMLQERLLAMLAALEVMPDDDAGIA